MNIHEILGRVWNTRLHFGTNLVPYPDLEPASIISPLSVTEKLGVLGIKYELKELRMNVYDTFWRSRPSVNKRRFEL